MCRSKKGTNGEWGWYQTMYSINEYTDKDTFKNKIYDYE